MSLIVEHINKWFGQFQAINDLSMEVEEGALFGFLGPNGAGKTTTMRMILDLFRPDSGQISWNGTPVREVARRSFGYLPEERGLYPRMEVEAQLLSYIPFWTPTLMLLRIALGTAAWWEIVLTIALMLVAILACTWFAARLYRYGVLMYGQRPGLGQLLKLVRMN